MKALKVILFVVSAVLAIHAIEYSIHINRVISAVWMMALLYVYRYFKSTQPDSNIDHDSTKKMMIFLVAGALIVTLGYFILRPFGDTPISFF